MDRALTPLPCTLNGRHPAHQWQSAFTRAWYRCTPPPMPPPGQTLVINFGRPSTPAASGRDVTAGVTGHVLRGLADGQSRTQIARALGATTDDVRKHTARLLQALGARTIAHAVHLAHQRGILATTETTGHPAGQT